MIIKQSEMFLSIGLPILIAYTLFIIGFIERRFGQERGPVFFSLRDACIAALALDMYQALSFFQYSFLKTESGFRSPVLIISCIMFAFHIGILMFSSRTPPSTEDDVGYRSRKFSFLRDMYLGLLTLMTNAVSITALVNMAGGIR